MSMLSLQTDELRTLAVKLRDVRLDDQANYAESVETMFRAMGAMREAAGTIESMRDRLQAAELGTCEFNVVEEFIPGKRQRSNICECSNCGYRFAYGFIVDERFKCCPNCGKRIREKVYYSS